jgi:hypothetical protein
MEATISGWVTKSRGLYDIDYNDVVKLISCPQDYIPIVSVEANEFSKLDLITIDTAPETIHYEHDKFSWVSINSFSDAKPLTHITLDDVVVRRNEIASFWGNVSKKEVSLEGLPKELDCALLTFKEFWENRPQDKNSAREEDINKFIKEKIGGQITEAALERIRTISRPENDRKGGAPNSERSTYKGKSKENT